MLASKLKPVHPGEILLEDFLIPMRLTCERVAEDLRLPVSELEEILQCKRSLNAETALRLARYFTNSAQFWFGLQMDYDLNTASDLVGDQIDKEVQIHVSED